MRACVVGGGLAGAMLAWRLAALAPAWRLDLVPGNRCRVDATSVSGGAVRAFETDAEQRGLAARSQAELLASKTLLGWARFRRSETFYLCRHTGDLEAAVGDIERVRPGSARLADAAELSRRGWADLEPGCVAVHEREAGYVSPGHLRDELLAEAARAAGVSVVDGEVGMVMLPDNGSVRCAVAGEVREYDLMVVAAGAWTPALLRAWRLSARGYRIQSIQYGLYLTGGWRPPTFIDELIGVFGRPTADGGLLLGRPTGQWGIDPNHPPTTPALHSGAARLAAGRFPRLRIGPAWKRVGSADCYAATPTLSLRRVVDSDHRLFTFTGGAGGAAKTALAASYRAALQLAESETPDRQPVFTQT